MYAVYSNHSKVAKAMFWSKWRAEQWIKIFPSHVKFRIERVIYKMLPGSIMEVVKYEYKRKNK